MAHLCLGELFFLLRLKKQQHLKERGVKTQTISCICEGESTDRECTRSYRTNTSTAMIRQEKRRERVCEGFEKNHMKLRPQRQQEDGR